MYRKCSRFSVRHTQPDIQTEADALIQGTGLHVKCKVCHYDPPKMYVLCTNTSALRIIVLSRKTVRDGKFSGNKVKLVTNSANVRRATPITTTSWSAECDIQSYGLDVSYRGKLLYI